ncbi:MAG TPA: hypothetical protein VIF64_12825 [Pyrinomonadaceae bacterium]
MARIPRKYPKSMSSLNALEIRCETDEAGLFGGLALLALGKDADNNNADVTAAQYETDGAADLNLGSLIFEEFTTDVDAGSREAIHKTQGEPLVCKGRAYINNEAKNVIVFREK